MGNDEWTSKRLNLDSANQKIGSFSERFKQTYRMFITKNYKKKNKSSTLFLEFWRNSL